MSPLTVLLILLLVVLLIGGLPPLGLHHYGPWPSGAVGVLLIIIIVMLITGRI
jgi:Protein of unknown function (DUF3309)